MIRAFCVACFVLLYILAVGGPLLAYTLVSGNTNLIYRAAVCGARIAVRLAGITLRVSGKENIPRGRAVVFMVNHQSNCDPAALIGHLPRVRILAKEGFFRVPILGRAMRLWGFIPVDRKCREKSIRAIEQATESLAAGHSFLVFPEGTRSADGRLLPFKKGVFIMAMRAGAPVVPISISGSRKIMQKGKAAIRPGEVRITFHAPVPTTGFAPEQQSDIQSWVRTAILAGLSREEWPLQDTHPL